MVVMKVSLPGSTVPLETRSRSDFSQKTSMGWLLPLMIWSTGRGDTVELLLVGYGVDGVLGA